jgi:DNA modification methylase
MKPFLELGQVSIYQGDVREVLPTLEAESVNCVITSPPYWGLRDYGTASWEGGLEECDHKQEAPRFNGPKQTVAQVSGHASKAESHARTHCSGCGAVRIDSQLGLERTPEEYISNMVGVFREVKRVLRADGTLWLNMGDSYCSTDKWGGGSLENTGKHTVRDDGGVPSWEATRRRKQPINGLKPKDLCGIPWMLAFALRADGWVLRQEIIWEKPNPMPESVTDRCTKAHESIFLFAKAKWVGPEPRRFAEISDQDARWLALFLDTEGNICAKKAIASNGTDHFGAQICFASTSKALLATAQGIIGAGTALERRGKNAPMFYLQLSNIQAADLLHRLHPFLIVKQRQAALAIHLQEIIATSRTERLTVEGKKRGRMRSQTYTDELLKIWATMKALNHFANPDLSWVPAPEIGHWGDCERYYYDAEEIKEKSTSDHEAGNNNHKGTTAYLEGDERHRTKEGLVKYAQKRRVKVPGGWDLGDGAHGTIHREGRTSATYLDQDGDPVDTRNKRSVWTVATQPFPEAHFATFPEELIKPCILAGCPDRCCKECGAPWERIVEASGGTIGKGWHDHKADATQGQRLLDQDASHGRNGKLPYRRETLGFEPSCLCGTTETRPGVVLDPFFGSGTTGLVARANGCKCIGIELNPEYIKIAAKRLRQEVLNFSEAVV